MATKKAPSKAQLAARKKFVEMVRAKAKAKKTATKKVIVKEVAGLDKVVRRGKKTDVKYSRISGITQKSIHTLNYLVKELQSAEQNYQVLKNRKRTEKVIDFAPYIEMYKRYPLYIRSLKKQITESKKHIK